MSTVEFAPEYTRTERVRFVVLSLGAGAFLMLLCQLWLFPWLREFAASAHCRLVFGFKGTSLLFYGVFVGVPLLAALLLGTLVGRRGYRVLREGRIPPSGEKVFRPTRIRRGREAKLSGYIQLVSPVPLLALAVWGGFQAQALVVQAESTRERCAPNPSIEGTSNIRLRLLSAAPHVKR